MTLFTIKDLPGINFSIEENEIIVKTARAAKDLKVPAYLIGGYVRDKILNRPCKDLDFMCVGNGIEFAEQTAKQFKSKPTVNIFKHFGTAQFRYHELDIEFVGARKESYSENSRNPAVETGTLEDDLCRRDFTINTLAFELLNEEEGILIDRFSGLKDLAGGIIKTPLDPNITFSDDPLRIMRAIRFASQLQFQIEEKTLQAITDNCARIKIISAERITDEFNKILLSEKPSVGLDLLYKTGIMQIIFPEFFVLAGTEMKEGKGHKDNFYHTLQEIDNVCLKSDNLWLRWAAVLHDIAKPVTKRFEAGTGWTFHGHDAVGARMVSKIFRRFKLPLNEKMKYVEKLVLLHLRPISLSKEQVTDAAIRRLMFEAGEDVDDLMKLCKADITSKNEKKVIRFLRNFELVQILMKEVEEKDNLRNFQPPIDGAIIMEAFDLKPGREVGEIKDAIREAILDGKLNNNYEEAFKFMLEEAGRRGIYLKKK
ncbi:MAG: HD domain-containing protein [Bacteroidota bacterium]